jgi:hypothetical protein
MVRLLRRVDTLGAYPPNLRLLKVAGFHLQLRPSLAGFERPLTPNADDGFCGFFDYLMIMKQLRPQLA